MNLSLLMDALNMLKILFRLGSNIFFRDMHVFYSSSVPNIHLGMYNIYIQDNIVCFCNMIN